MIATAYCQDRVSRPPHRQGESNSLPELRRWNWRSKEAKVAKVYGAE